MIRLFRKINAVEILRLVLKYIISERQEIKIPSTSQGYKR